MGRGGGGGRRGARIARRTRARYARRVRASEARSAKQGWDRSRGGRTDFSKYRDTEYRKDLRDSVREWQKMTDSQKSANLRKRGLRGRGGRGGGGGGGGGGGEFESAMQLDMDAIKRDAAIEAFEHALGMCGNEGQVAIIEAMSDEAWYEAATNGGYDTLVKLSPHPEAVDKAILPESWAVMAQFIAWASTENWEEYILS